MEVTTQEDHFPPPQAGHLASRGGWRERTGETVSVPKLRVRVTLYVLRNTLAPHSSLQRVKLYRFWGAHLAVLPLPLPPL